jgi:hypothetical protein
MTVAAYTSNRAPSRFNPEFVNTISFEHVSCCEIADALVHLISPDNLACRK